MRANPKYKIRVKNKETKSSWTIVVARDEDPFDIDDSSSTRGTSVSDEVVQLLEDSNLVSNIKEISESILDMEPSDISWNEKILKINFEDCDSDAGILEVIEALREHLEDILDSCVTEDPEED
jgi:hypothetical protein